MNDSVLWVLLVNMIHKGRLPRLTYVHRLHILLYLLEVLRVDFREVIKVRTGLAKGSRQRLLLAFYTMIPPLRCDLNRVALLQCPASAATISPDEVDAVRENNFLCLPEADRKKPAILVLREFKTANSAGVWRRTLPMNLTQELWTSLQAEPPRRWLFNTKSGSPYTAKNFSKRCCSVLQTLFDRPLTLTLLRHSYLNSMDWNKLTIASRESLAADMCHSTETQDTYRWTSGNRILRQGKKQKHLQVI